MIALSKRTILAICVGIASSIILSSLTRASPYILAIGPVIGMIIGKPATIKDGALLSLIIGAPLTFFLALTHAIPGGIHNNPLLASLEILFILTFWGIFGAFLVFIKQGWERNKPWFF